MKEARHDDLKIDSQVERLIFFTDGVFAIAITLLVIEIKIPVVSMFTDEVLFESLTETLFKFVGFLISFGIIGHYWSVHHRIFGYVKRYNSFLIWLNLGFLLSIVTLPFSSGLVGEYITHPNMYVPYIIYTANICFTGFMNCILWLYVSNPKREFLTRNISTARIRLGVYRSLVIPVVFLISMSASFILPIFVSRIILLLIPIVFHWGMIGLENSADRTEKIISKKIK